MSLTALKWDRPRAAFQGAFAYGRVYSGRHSEFQPRIAGTGLEKVGLSPTLKAHTRRVSDRPAAIQTTARPGVLPPTARVRTTPAATTPLVPIQTAAAGDSLPALLLSPGTFRSPVLPTLASGFFIHGAMNV